MQPPDGLRLGVGLYSPASNKTRAPRLKQTAFKKWIGPECRIRKLSEASHRFVGYTKKGTALTPSGGLYIFIYATKPPAGS
jgi:hypothetical protein